MKRKISLICSLVMVMQLLFSAMVLPAAAADDVTAPEFDIPIYNMNVDWKFTTPSGSTFPLAAAADSVAKGGKQFYDIDYDDSDWETVSVPHPINASDSFDSLIADAGESGLYRGFMFYRKTITVPADAVGKKLFLEFEAVRQSVYLYVNGEMVGYYEAGVAPIGFDITDFVTPGAEAVIAVATDNNSDRGVGSTWTSAEFGSLSTVTRETVPGNTPGDGSGYTYQWNTKDFNEVQGGITGNVNLYVKGEVYQTLPLYNNLKTTGNYIYASNFDIDNKTADITVEAEIRNETAAAKNVTLDVYLIDEDDNVAATFSGTATAAAATDAGTVYKTVVPEDAYEDDPDPTNADTVDVTKLTATANVLELEFWSPDYPYLYEVVTVLKDSDGTVLDTASEKTGFRKISYDINNGGLMVNDQSVWLTGYAQRATDEWAVIGVANDWLYDYDMQLTKESNANFIRWMHVAPKPAAVRSGDKYGVVSVCPAGDKEGDVDGRQWAMRVETMRDVMIYFRNSPSVFFWEAGNASISAEHMQEMTDLKNEIDPNGGRFAGSRSISGTDQIEAADYAGTMLNRYASSAKAAMTSINKFVPIVETEYAREEAPRRVWDDFSPPDYDYDNKWLGDGASKTDGYDVYDLTSEDFVLSNIAGYAEFYNDRVGGKNGTDYYSAAAALVWADSNQHGRNAGSENARTSGRVDAVRIKKQSFYAFRVIQSTETDIKIIGHWSYPELTDDTYNYAVKEFNGTYWAKTGETAKRDPEHKTVYVIGTTDIAKMELYVNDTLVGTDKTPDSTFIFAFADVDVTQSGTVKAVAYNNRDEVIAEDEISTVGDAVSLRLTPVTGPDGLIADGSDVMFYDVDVVDEDGNVCPLNYDKITFEISGEGEFLGGYNSGKFGDDSVIGKNYCYAECGTNRVFIKSTQTAGTITLKATMEGLAPATATITSQELTLDGGLTTEAQRTFERGKIIAPETTDTVPAMKPLAPVFTALWGVNTRFVEETDDKDVYTVTVNGTEVSFATDAYRPDSTTGVLCDVISVLDAVIAAGADVSYEVITEGDLPSYVESGKLPIVRITSGSTTVDVVNASTTLYINSGEDKNLMNAEAEYNDSGEMVIEIAAAIAYLDGVTAQMDADSKTQIITVS